MISKEEVGKRITIDVERKEKVYDFFISCGWITTGNHIHDMNYECFFQTNILILLCFSIPSSTKNKLLLHGMTKVIDSINCFHRCSSN